MTKRALTPIAVAVVLCVIGVDLYGPRDLFPGVFGNFAASLFAFTLALAWGMLDAVW